MSGSYKYDKDKSSVDCVVSNFESSEQYLSAKGALPEPLTVIADYCRRWRSEKIGDGQRNSCTSFYYSISKNLVWTWKIFFLKNIYH